MVFRTVRQPVVCETNLQISNNEASVVRSCRKGRTARPTLRRADLLYEATAYGSAQAARPQIRR